MRTNEPKINTTESADEGNKCKREWIKPEVEVISSDLIKGGVLDGYSEGFRTVDFGLRGVS